MRTRSVPSRYRASAGLTLVEVLVALVLGAFILLGLNGVVSRSLGARDIVTRSHRRTEQARFALERMVRGVQGTPRLLIPLPENLGTAHSESVRDVLAVELDPAIDRDGNGNADADNDGDGAVDEDPDRDAGSDGAAGLPGLDDDGDGVVDESVTDDDDEDGTSHEDGANFIDDDGDGAVDEDGDQDRNGDGQPGVAGVDDDADGSVDEGNPRNDDEDGAEDEDWIDAAAWFASGGRLFERWPTPGAANGTQYTESAIAEGVTLFRVERVEGAENRATLVDITLELTDASGEKLSLNARARVGGGG